MDDFLPPRGQNTHAHNTYNPHHIAHPNNGAAGQKPQYPPHPLFRSPEETARREAAAAASGSGLSGGQTSSADAPPPSPPRKKSFKQRLKELTKKQWAVIIAFALILLVGGGFAVHALLTGDEPKPVKRATKKEAPAPPQPLVSTLTGLPIADAAVNQRPVTAVMIENSPDARPQSGLNLAGVVFEAVAEGGITRFVTLFQDSEPDYIGPVRSVRPYYIQWLTGFDAGVAHVGGSAQALAMLKEPGSKDLDQFRNPGPYHRVKSRFAPHNMYSSVIKLRELQSQKGFTSKYTGFARKAEAKNPAPNAVSIDFNISGALYNPHYDYDAASNSYKRSEGGRPHIDEKSGQQLAPKVVVALTMAQGRNGIYTTYGTIGSGEAHIFQDGVLTKGTWHKNSNKDQFVFKDASGATLKLNPGQTWISVVGGSNRVTFR